MRELRGWKRVRGLLAIVLAMAIVLETPNTFSIVHAEEATGEGTQESSPITIKLGDSASETVYSSGVQIKIENGLTSSGYYVFYDKGIRQNNGSNDISGNGNKTVTLPGNSAEQNVQWTYQGTTDDNEAVFKRYYEGETYTVSEGASYSQSGLSAISKPDTTKNEYTVSNLSNSTAVYVTVYNVAKKTTVDSNESEYLYKAVADRRILMPDGSMTITPKYDNQEVEAERVYALEIKDCTVIEDKSFEGVKVGDKWYVKAGKLIELRASSEEVTESSQVAVIKTKSSGDPVVTIDSLTSSQDQGVYYNLEMPEMDTEVSFTSYEDSNSLTPNQYSKIYKDFFIFKSEYGSPEFKVGNSNNGQIKFSKATIAESYYSYVEFPNSNQRLWALLEIDTSSSTPKYTFNPAVELWNATLSNEGGVSKVEIKVGDDDLSNKSSIYLAQGATVTVKAQSPNEQVHVRIRGESSDVPVEIESAGNDSYTFKVPEITEKQYLSIDTEQKYSVKVVETSEAGSGVVVGSGVVGDEIQFTTGKNAIVGFTIGGKTLPLGTVEDYTEPKTCVKKNTTTYTDSEDDRTYTYRIGVDDADSATKTITITPVYGKILDLETMRTNQADYEKEFLADGFIVLPKKDKGAEVYILEEQPNSEQLRSYVADQNQTPAYWLFDYKTLNIKEDVNWKLVKIAENSEKYYFEQSHAITVSDSEGISSVINKTTKKTITSAWSGEQVQVTLSDANRQLTVTPDSGSDIEIKSGVEANTYFFTMPQEAVTLSTKKIYHIHTDNSWLGDEAAETIKGDATKSDSCTLESPTSTNFEEGTESVSLKINVKNRNNYTGNVQVYTKSDEGYKEHETEYNSGTDTYDVTISNPESDIYIKTTYTPWPVLTIKEINKEDTKYSLYPGMETRIIISSDSAKEGRQVVDWLDADGTSVGNDPDWIKQNPDDKNTFLFTISKDTTLTPVWGYVIDIAKTESTEQKYGETLKLINSSESDMTYCCYYKGKLQGNEITIPAGKSEIVTLDLPNSTKDIKEKLTWKYTKAGTTARFDSVLPKHQLTVEDGRIFIQVGDADSLIEENWTTSKPGKPETVEEVEYGDLVWIESYIPDSNRKIFDKWIINDSQGNEVTELAGYIKYDPTNFQMPDCDLTVKGEYGYTNKYEASVVVPEGGQGNCYINYGPDSGKLSSVYLEAGSTVSEGEETPSLRFVCRDTFNPNTQTALWTIETKDPYVEGAEWEKDSTVEANEKISTDSTPCLYVSEMPQKDIRVSCKIVDKTDVKSLTVSDNILTHATINGADTKKIFMFVKGETITLKLKSEVTGTEGCKYRVDFKDSEGKITSRLFDTDKIAFPMPAYDVTIDGGLVYPLTVVNAAITRAVETVHGTRNEIRDLKQEYFYPGTTVNLTFTSGSSLSIARWYFDEGSLKGVTDDKTQKIEYQTKATAMKVEAVETPLYRVETEKGTLRGGIVFEEGDVDFPAGTYYSAGETVWVNTGVNLLDNQAFEWTTYRVDRATGEEVLDSSIFWNRFAHEYVITMPECDIKVTYKLVNYYNVTLINTSNGTAYTDCKENTEKNLQPATLEGQNFVKWLITKDETGEDVTADLIRDNLQPNITYKMPSYAITIKALFEKAAEAANFVVRSTANGTKLRLGKGIPYKLDTGKTWKVNGDTTSYVGGMTFYVSDTAEYSFE